ncbi:hypothetical protein BN14_09622 [Rhizoctonia solani AG-1 IB]|uniref:Uncharacterized protein n=1 Tax=Thanatephorus cucumeris (strain AG1-IB / isolate 7/3/14) TaxID=1108050 RepID=M5C835_THACB|nr:hypothetical protein BN14_09622 [Rhizoctonia solani AG-1 IB]
MDIVDCRDYLSLNEALNLVGALAEAYYTKNYEQVIHHRLMPSSSKQAQLGGYSMKRSKTKHSLQSAFESSYIGNTAKLFIDTLARELQSSGMGKSRMVAEAGNMVFTIPINIREALPAGRIAYPPPDANVRRFFFDRQRQSDKEQRANYMIFLQVLFTQVEEIFATHFEHTDRSKLALAWATYLKEGEDVVRVGRNRIKLYESVINRVNKATQNLQLDQSSLYRLEVSMRASCDRLVQAIRPGRPDGTNRCFVYFDEAHSLIDAVQQTNEQHERSQYQNLGTVLASLVDYDIFFIFLSTNSRLEGFAPPPASHPADRATNGSKLITPFTEMPFDIYEETVLDKVKTLTLESMAKTETSPEKDIFDFAVDKLTASGIVDREEDALLAILGVRIGVAFNETNHATYSVQSRLVESHLRVVYSIPEHRGYMHTGAPSESILAEVAARYLNAPGSGRGGIAAIGPRRLSEALKKGFLARGERGKIAGRLLVTSAYERALNIDLSQRAHPLYYRPIPVIDFLFALFHPDHHTLVKEAKPVTVLGDSLSLGEAFSEAYVFFSHFALAEDAKMLSSPGLAIALVRGMALYARDGQESIDAVIPVHMGPITSPISPSTTSAINLQFKNRPTALECNVKRSITVPDPNVPAISIVFELGVTGRHSTPVAITNKTPRNARSTGNVLHHNDRHYQILAKGCDSATFKVISTTEEPQYKTILGAGTILQDFHRRGSQDNVDALLRMKPVFSVAREQERYNKRWLANSARLPLDPGVYS